MRSTLALLISIQVFSLTLAEEDPEVDIFAVRRTSSNIRSQPAFEHTNAHAGEMPLARILAFAPEDQGRLTQFDEEPQLHEKVMLAEMRQEPLQQQQESQIVERDRVFGQRRQQPAPAPVKRKKPLQIPPPPTKSVTSLPPSRSQSAPQSAPMVRTRYLGIGRRDPNEEVFPSDFLRERAAKLRRQEEYERIQQQNPDGRWYFFVPARVSVPDSRD